jgi:hypothetical protein
MRLQIRTCRIELSLLSPARRAQRDTFVREGCKNGVKRLIPRSTEAIIPG